MFKRIIISILGLMIMMMVLSHYWSSVTAAVFLLLLIAHESGHIVALGSLGKGWKIPYFIPFIGAIIVIDEENTLREDAIIGIAGPLAGFLITTVAYYIFSAYSCEKDIITGVIIATMINIVNLIPTGSLDGGRVMKIVSSKIHYLGFLILLVFIVWIKGYILAILASIYMYIKIKSSVDIKGEDLIAFNLFIVAAGISLLSRYEVPAIISYPVLIVFIAICFNLNKRLWLKYRISKKIKKIESMIIIGVEEVENAASISDRILWGVIYVLLLVGLVLMAYLLINMVQ